MFPQLFHRRSTGRSKEKEDIQETVRTLIEARFDRLEEKQRSLEREWADCYDKIMLLYDRTRKRIGVLKKASGEEQPIEAVQTPPATKDDILRAYIAQNGAQ